MKISKNPVKCNDDVIPNITESNYAETLEYIRSAIDSLTDKAKTDEVAKNAIADLSVVLFELM